MKKSNWIILVLLVVASALLLWLWYYLGFNYVDSPLDLVLSIVWWVAVVAFIALIIRAEKKRQRAIRSIYVGPDKLFNIEAGVVDCPDPEQRVAVMQNILNNLKYSFGNHAERPSADEFRYQFIVDSDVYKPSDSAADQEPEWKGSVSKVSSKHVSDFDTRGQLSRMMI